MLDQATPLQTPGMPMNFWASADRRTTSGDPALKISIFAINYAPDHFGVCPYATGVAEHYAEQGHSVTVVTGVPHYPEWKRKPVPPKAVSSGLNPTVRRYNHFIPAKAGALGRTVYEISWLASAIRAVPRMGCDVAIGIVPSLSGAALAWLTSVRCRVPYVVVFQDLMGPSAAQSGYQGGGWVAGLASKAERALARHADQVGVISEAFAPYLVAGGVDPNKIVVAPNWARRTDPVETRDVVRNRYGWRDNEFVCLHAGTMGQKQGLDNVIEAAALLKDEGFRFVMAGDGNDRSRLKSLSDERHVDNVQFVEPQGPGSYESLLSAADLLILNQRAAVDEMSLPSKLTTYFASGRPSVAAVAPLSASAKEIRAAGAGLVVPPDRPGELAEAIRRIRNDPDMTATLGERGIRYVQDHLSSMQSFIQYDDLLGRAVAKDPVYDRAQNTAAMTSERRKV